MNEAAIAKALGALLAEFESDGVDRMTATEYFPGVVKALLTSLAEYEARVDDDMLMHDLAMGRPLRDLEPEIRSYAARYCARARGALRGRPVTQRRRNALIRVLMLAAREHRVDDGDARRIIAEKCNLTVGAVRAITNEGDRE